MPPPTTPYRAAPPLRPSRAALVGPLVGAALCALLAVFTSHKLVAMARLRGWLDGAPPRTLVVAGEGTPLGTSTVVIPLSDPLAPGAARDSIQARAHQFGRLRLGASVTVRCDSSRECYLPDSVYIEDGNVAFDLALLALELGGLVALGVVAYRRRRDLHALYAPR